MNTDFMQRLGKYFTVFRFEFKSSISNILFNIMAEALNMDIITKGTYSIKVSKVDIKKRRLVMYNARILILLQNFLFFLAAPNNK